MPGGARPSTRRGIRGVEWVTPSGDQRWAKLAADGKRIEVRDENWTIQYTDASGKKREQSAGTPSRTGAEEIAAALVLKVARQKAGVHDERDSSLATHSRTSIEHHLTGSGNTIGYLQHLADKDDSARYVRDTKAQIQRVLTAANIRTLADFESSRVSRAVASLRDDDKPLSGRTRNGYIRACKAFSTWLWRRKRTREDQLRDLDTVRTEPTRKLRRRALTPAEFDKIKAAAEASEVVVIGQIASGGKRRLSLPHRVWAYRLAAATGLRANEIGTLTRASFDFNACTVTVEAGYSKRRRHDVQPLPSEFAAELQAWIESMPKRAPLFPGSKRWGAALKADARAAGVPVKTAEGSIDFHCLRHTYATRVAATAPDVKTGQSLTRHSSPSLYLNVYAKEQAKARTATVNAMPSV
jgi:integrase